MFFKFYSQEFSVYNLCKNILSPNLSTMQIYTRLPLLNDYLSKGLMNILCIGKFINIWGKLIEYFLPIYLDRLALFQYNSMSQKKSRRCKHEENLSTK